ADRPELLPFLPMVYAAWSDGVLSAPELAAIRDRAAAQAWLEQDAREALAGWLDPDRPPSAPALLALRERLRGLGTGPEDETRRSLVELGLALAHAEAGEGVWDHVDARRALRDLERELGTAPEEAVRRVLASGPPERVPAPA